MQPVLPLGVAFDRRLTWWRANLEAMLGIGRWGQRRGCLHSGDDYVRVGRLFAVAFALHPLSHGPLGETGTGNIGRWVPC